MWAERVKESGVAGVAEWDHRLPVVNGGEGFGFVSGRFDAGACSAKAFAS